MCKQGTKKHQQQKTKEENLLLLLSGLGSTSTSSTSARSSSTLGGALLADANKTSVGTSLSQPLEHADARVLLLVGDLAVTGLDRGARHRQHLLALELRDGLGGGKLCLLLVLQVLLGLLGNASAARENHKL